MIAICPMLIFEEVPTMSNDVRDVLHYGRYITDETIDADGHSVRVRLIDCDGAIWYVSMLDGAVITAAQV